MNKFVIFWRKAGGDFYNHPFPLPLFFICRKGLQILFPSRVEDEAVANRLKEIWTNIVDIVEEDGSFFIQRFEVFVQNLLCLILKLDAFDNLSGIDLLHVNLMV